jgi:hypothetical protein
MAHNFALVEAGTQILFECLVCSRQIAFARPGEGEPSAIPNGDGWLPAENADDYLESCETPITPQVPVPDKITKRQFLIQLIRSSLVTEAEAATVATQPPALVESMLSPMSAEAKLEARLTWASMTEVLRHDPLVELAIASGVMTSEQADQFFIAAAEI